MGKKKGGEDDEIGGLAKSRVGRHNPRAGSERVNKCCCYPPLPSRRLEDPRRARPVEIVVVGPEIVVGGNPIFWEAQARGRWGTSVCVAPARAPGRVAPRKCRLYNIPSPPCPLPKHPPPPVPPAQPSLVNN